MTWYKFERVILTVSVEADDEAQAIEKMEEWNDGLLTQPPGFGAELNLDEPYTGPELADD